MQHCQYPHTASNLSNLTRAGQQNATLCLGALAPGVPVSTTSYIAIDRRSWVGQWISAVMANKVLAPGNGREVQASAAASVVAGWL
jgi:hypothetical protein